MTTSRTRFNQSWLIESPEGMSHTQTHSTLTYNINDLKKSGVEVKNTINPKVKKIELTDHVYYWIQDSDGTIQLAVELTKKPDNLTVNLTGKNELLTGKSPYADELYQTILNDSGKPMLFSDAKLTDSGKKIWKRLVQSGRTVTVYDNQNPGKSRQTITSPKDLDKFWKMNDPTYQRWQYVLSESGEMTHNIIATFNTRRARELCGMGTEDYVPENTSKSFRNLINLLKDE